MSFNKIDFLFFPTGYSCCTFVSSKKANGGAARESGETLIHRFETFHEIIYGKPTRRKRAPGFFLPVHMRNVKQTPLFAPFPGVRNGKLNLGVGKPVLEVFEDFL